MKKILKLVLSTMVIAVAIGGLIALIGWLLKWKTATQFSDGFFLAGALIVVLGILSVMGGYSIRSSFGVIYSQSAGDMNTYERSKRWIADITQAYSVFVLLLLVGLYLIGFAVAIPGIFQVP